MRSDKYDSFSEEDRQNITNDLNLNTTDIQIKDPDNPAKLIDAKLITLEIV